MWILLIFAGLMFWALGSTTRQLTTGKFGRVGARVLYVLVWACFIGAGIDVARAHNLYAPLLAMGSVLMFYAAFLVLQSERLRRIATTNAVFKWVAGCFVAGIMLLLAAIADFVMWRM